MHSRSRTASFRRSVVSVAAAFAAAPGCAIDHDESGKDIDQINPPTCDVGSTATGCVPSAECTEAPPELDAPCTDEGAICYYDSCSTADNVDEARCTDGKWQLGQSSCNPPEPPVECPGQVPAYGDTCWDASGVTCTYDCEGGQLEATCLDGAWDVIDACAATNPPEPECPEEAPADGDPCDSGGMYCEYGACTVDDPTVSAECVGNFEGEGDITFRWQLDQVPCLPRPPESPDAPPADTSACTIESLYCTYNTLPDLCSEGTWTVTAECYGSNWFVDEYQDCQSGWKG